MNGAGQRVTPAQVRRELRRMDDTSARKRRFVWAVAILAVAYALGTLAAHFALVVADVRTDAMADTLSSGDVAVCLRTDIPFTDLHAPRGALVLARYLEAGMQREALRRVIAVGGDVISVDSDGRVTLNGEALEEAYVTYRSQTDWIGDEPTPGGALENPFAQESPQIPVGTAETTVGIDDMNYPYTVPEGELFVLCDNRGNLLDSRSSRFGRITEAEVLGIGQAVIWPVYRARPLGQSLLMRLFSGGGA